MRCFYLLVLLLVLAAGANAQNKKLSVIGSSTSACTGPSSFATCYLGRLDAYQDGIAQPMDLFQLAVGGYNVYKGMPSSFVGPSPTLQPDPNNNITKALSFAPDVVLVNYPSNDYDVLNIDSIMRCFRTIRDSANIQGKTCYITTTQPRHTFPFDNMANRVKLKVLRDSIMAAFGYYAIDFWTGLADPTTYMIMPAYNADGTHLNDAGHDILFQRVRDKNIFVVQLPVKLLSFTAKQQGDITISWSVADELPGTQYEVQRSTDGLTFETIHTVTSTRSASKRNYEVVNQSALAGLYYYRLRVTENAKTFFSQVVKVSSGKQIALKSFSVDPVQHQLIIKFITRDSKRVKLNFINSAGVTTLQTNHLLQPGENRIALSLYSLPPGTYWTECIADDTRIFTKPFRTF